MNASTSIVKHLKFIAFSWNFGCILFETLINKEEKCVFVCGLVVDMFGFGRDSLLEGDGAIGVKLYKYN